MGKGGTAGFLGRAYDPYTLYPDQQRSDMSKMERIRVDHLKLRPEVFASRLQRRAKLRDTINAGMPEVDKAVQEYNLDLALREGSQPGAIRQSTKLLISARKPQRSATAMAAIPSDRACSSPDDWSKLVPGWSK